MPQTPDGIWYPNLFGKQLQVFNSTSRALLVCGPRKSGKCISGESIVQIGNGLRRLRRLGEPIKQGDYVFNNTPVVSFDRSDRRMALGQTSGFYRDRSTEALRLTVRGGFQIKTSFIHPLWSCVDGVEDFRPAADINNIIGSGRDVYLPIVVGHDRWTNGDCVEVSFLPMDKQKRLRFERNRRIRKAIRLVGVKKIYKIAALAGTTYHTVKAFLSDPNDVQQYSVTLDEDLAYLIGAIIGDGCCTPANIKKNRICLSGNDLEVMDRCRAALENHFPGSALVHIKGCDWDVRSPGLRGLIVAFEMNCYAHEKRIPDAIIESPMSVVRAFLSALFDTDGTADKRGRVSFCSSSEILSRDVQQLLLNFGILASIVRKKTACRDAFIVSLNGSSRLFYKKIGFGIKRKQERQSGLPNCGTLHRSVYPSPKQDRQRIMMDGNVVWRKIIECKKDSCDLYDVTVPQHHSFIAGGFINHNTWATLHRIVRHLWETPSARVAMFSRTLKNSKEGGTWSDLHTIILPEWFSSRIGIRYTTKSQDGTPGPKVDGQTRTPYFKVRNRYGKESELMLFSLDHDPDIEDKLKEQRFSMIYFSELSKFRDRRILSVALPSLRMPHLRMEDQMWIADTNPSEEGDASWIYEVWYVERLIGHTQYSARQKERGLPSMPESVFLNFQRGLDLIEIRPEENPFLDPAELEELKSTYAYDEGLYARYVEGKWVYGNGDTSIHFKGKFFPNKHVIGTVNPDPDECLCANPSENCFELVTGWDLGEVNHAFVVLERMVVNGKSHFVVLDELESIGEEVDNATFTEGALEIVQSIEETTGRQFGLERAWSDNSSFSFKASSGSYPYLEVYAASGNRIYLQAVPKPKDSVRARVMLLKQLLVQDRIKISAHCKAVIRMLGKLRKGANVLNYVVPDENKHIFDALTYALLMEMAEEFELGAARGTTRHPLIVSIGR